MPTSEERSCDMVINRVTTYPVKKIALCIGGCSKNEREEKDLVPLHA